MWLYTCHRACRLHSNSGGEFSLTRIAALMLSSPCLCGSICAENQSQTAAKTCLTCSFFLKKCTFGFYVVFYKCFLAQQWVLTLTLSEYNGENGLHLPAFCKTVFMAGLINFSHVSISCFGSCHCWCAGSNTHVHVFLLDRREDRTEESSLIYPGCI